MPLGKIQAVVYQIYPRSYKDSNNDGVGDIPGIASDESLNHLKELGVDVVWVSPFFKSPQVDFGYDISDYCDVDPQYGTVQDVETLIKGLHDRGMKLVIDGVWNHTSDQHPWFIESASSRDNPKADWYIWRDPKIDHQGNRHPPNNWAGGFEGGCAWVWVEARQQYYLHLFAIEQPDLNWTNEDVRNALYDTMRFWLEKGVDGFRMDVIAFISKVQGLPDAEVTDPSRLYQDAHKLFANGPRLHEYLKEMHAKVLSKYDVLTVGECPFTNDTSKMVEFTKPGNRELQMIFTFEHTEVDEEPGKGKYSYRKPPLVEYKAVWNKYQTEIPEKGGWVCNYLSNHDQGRPIYRLADGSPQYRDISAKMLATFLVTLSGTMYIYEGEEIGMGCIPDDWPIEDYLDVSTQLNYNQEYEKRKSENPNQEPDMSDLMKALTIKSRDGSRTPMAWNTKKDAGFSNNPDKADKPWMRVIPDFDKYNVETEQKDPNSILSFWKAAIKFKKANLACTYGVFRQLESENEQLFIYTKKHATHNLLVVINWTPEPLAWKAPSEFDISKRVFGNYSNTAVEGDMINLESFEAVVFKV